MIIRMYSKKKPKKTPKDKILDMENRFGGATADNIWLEVAYTKDDAAMKQFVEELRKEFPSFEIVSNPLSLSVACHIGPGALAVACCKKLK